MSSVFIKFIIKLKPIRYIICYYYIKYVYRVTLPQLFFLLNIFFKIILESHYSLLNKGLVIKINTISVFVFTFLNIIRDN